MDVSPSTAATSVVDRYQTLVSDGHIKADAAQAHAAMQLDGLCQALKQEKSKPLLRRLLRRPKPATDRASGIYIYGAVGRGKSMLMDLFFDIAPIAAKRRVHFHDFMLDVHKRLHRIKNEGSSGSSDGVRLLCDELLEMISLMSSVYSLFDS